MIRNTSSYNDLSTEAVNVELRRTHSFGTMLSLADVTSVPGVFGHCGKPATACGTACGVACDAAELSLLHVERRRVPLP
jgi:hypothetical protein